MKRNQPKLPAVAKSLTPVSSFPVPMPIPNAGQAPPPPRSSGHTQFVVPPVSPIVGVSIESTKNLLNHLRMVRDSQAYKAEGANNFREWTMKQFGDRIGIFLDEML